MAEQQVLNWIGGTVSPPNQAALKLSRNIDSFETDFANGYLFGEILSQYGVSAPIQSFSKKNNKESKVNNFYQVEESLRFLKVNFDAKLIHQIMNEERGASLRLLYQIKLSLDRYFSENKTTVTGLKPKVVDKRVKQVSDLATSLPAIKSQYGIEGSTLAPGKNFKIVEDKLLKFEKNHADLRERARQGDMQEKNMLQSLQQEKRQLAMSKLKENKDFMKDWEAKNRQNWKKNQHTRAYEIQRALDFDDREVRIYKNKLERELNFNNEDMINGVEAFHENMNKLGVEQNITIAEAMKRMDEKKGIPPGQIQNFSYAATMNKIKETKNNNEFAGKERERRNRKMLVDQRAIQATLDTKKHEESLIQKLLDKQSSEQKLAMSMQRQRKCHDLVLQNRKKKQEAQAEVKLKLNEFLDQKMRKDAEEYEGPRRKAHQEGQDNYRNQRRDEKAVKRRVNIEIASELFDLIMDVAETAHDVMDEGQLMATRRHAEGIEEDSDDYEESQLIKKPQWRHWMNIFTDGKKVSEENLVIEEEATEQQPKGQGLDSMSQLLQANTKEPQAPYKLMADIRSEPIFTDLLQYISQTGQLNLRLVATDKWQLFRDILMNVRQSQAMSGQSNASTPREMSERSLVDDGFMNSIYLPKNVELGKFIERLYSSPVPGLAGSPSLDDQALSMAANMVKATDRSAISEINQASEKGSIKVGGKNLTDALSMVGSPDFLGERIFKPDFPTYHPIKLCMLGSSFAGKKTSAQCIQKKLGDNITCFNMNDILREALNYVDPNQKQEEVVDPKGKKKPAETPVDIYAGKDTTRYKEIANLLLKQVQLTTGDDTQLPGKDSDLVDIINDHENLVQLFTQKLKLTFPATGPSEQEREAALQERMDKEDGLLKELEEAKVNETAEVDPKAKGKAKAVKSSQDVRDEIKNLLSFEKSGWILLDFPRNLTQGKLLEKAFTGYQAISDRPKAPMFEQQEVWTKLTDADSTLDTYDAEIEAQPSLFDCVFMLETDQEECLRRARNRKIDPTTQTVYHAEDSPAPEADAKLVERLTDFFGNYADADEMINKTENNCKNYASYKHVLQEFFGAFGQFDRFDKKGFETLRHVSVINGNSKDSVKEQVDKLLEQMCDFKQIEEDRKFSEFKDKIKAEEERKKLEQEELKSQENTTSGVDKKSATGEEKKPTLDAAVSQDKSNKDNASPMGGNQLGAEINVSKTSIHSKMSMSQSGIGATTGGVTRSRKKNRIEYTRDYKVKCWEEMEVSYLKDGVMSLSDIKRQRLSVTNNLNNCQRQFIEFLERHCEKQEKVNEFVQSFNQFSSEFPDLRKDDQTKDELNSRLERLSNNLWEITEARKDESLQRIAEMAKSGWSNQEMRQVVRNMSGLVEIEIKKMTTVYTIVMQQEPPVELDAEIYAKKLLERGVQPFDGSKGTSPALEQVFGNLLTKVNELIFKNQAVLPVLAEEQGVILRKEKDVLSYRLAQIYAWALAMLEEIYVNSRQVYDRLDDWIVDAVAQENYISSEVINFIKEAISNETMYIDEFQAQMQPIELFSKLEVIQYRSDEIPLYMRTVVTPNDQIETTRFEVNQLRHLFKEMRFNSGGLGHSGLIEVNSFTNILVLALRHGKVPLVWRYLDFNQLMHLNRKFEILPLQSPRGHNNQQLAFLAQNQSAASLQSWINWKNALLAFALLRSDLPTQDNIDKLKEAFGENEYINKETLKQTAFWFDAVEGKPAQELYAHWMTEKRNEMQEEEYDSELDDNEVAQELEGKHDVDRLKEIKSLIFDLYRVQTGEDKLHIPVLLSALNSCQSSSSNVTTFEQFLFYE